MVTLQFFTEEHFPDLNYQLDEIQLQYTSSAEMALQRIKERNDGKAFPITILYEEKPVGFFVLDFGEDKFDLTDNPNSTLLRSLSVNPKGKLCYKLMISQKRISGVVTKSSWLLIKIIFLLTNYI